MLDYSAAGLCKSFWVFVKLLKMCYEKHWRKHNLKETHEFRVFYKYYILLYYHIIIYINNVNNTNLYVSVSLYQWGSESVVV